MANSPYLNLHHDNHPWHNHEASAIPLARRKRKGKNMSTLEITYKALGDLNGYEHNSRTHNKKQIEQIAASIEEFGFTNPILVDEKDTIIAGHGRLSAARTLKMKEVPTICIRNLSEQQMRALVIADNRIAENAGWDEEMLKVEIRFLNDTAFDLDLLGFEDDELKDLVEIEIPNLDDDTFSNDESEKKYTIIVELSDEEQQEDAYLLLTKQGYKCVKK